MDRINFVLLIAILALGIGFLYSDEIVQLSGNMVEVVAGRVYKVDLHVEYPISCLPSKEICDGIDNDCDDRVDEGCPMCGNNVVELEEQCDVFDMSGQTCETEGFAGGSLRCNRDCTLNTDQCAECLDPFVKHNGQCCRSTQFLWWTFWSDEQGNSC